MPACSRSSRWPCCEIMPRSPTITNCAMPKCIAQALDLGQQGLAVGDIAFVHRDRHRAATGIGEQAVVDLQLAPSCHRGYSRAWPADRSYPRSNSTTGHRAPGCPSRRWRAASFFSIASWRASSQSIAAYRSSSLAPSTPKSSASVVRVPPARGRQLGMRRNDACRHHRQHQVALAAGLGGDQRGQTQALHGRGDRLHMARAARERMTSKACVSRHEGLALQRAADDLDQGIGQVREIAQRLVLDDLPSWR